ncbi:MAG TPA: hypothetical protein DDW85_02225 [Porphyromonadaceae bacterium]|nr:hypothetical protein [Porphyromonadaceae bacterium]
MEIKIEIQHPWITYFSGSQNEIMTFVLTDRVDVEMNLITGITTVIKDKERIIEDKFDLKEECSFDEVIAYLRMQYRDAASLPNL